MSNKVIQTDCLVIGAGLAGSAYALQVARAGLQVQLLSMGQPEEANSDWAQGGIIYDTQAQSSQTRGGSLREDIIAASDGAANPAAVEQLVREGPAAVQQLLLDELQVGFDRSADGELEYTREGGHSERRIIHARDLTGHAIHSAISAAVDSSANIHRQVGATAIDLLTLSHNTDDIAARYAPLTCFGAWVLPACDGENAVANDPVAIVARKTILATGGLGQVYQYSTNRPGTVGHGMAMAYRVGARVIDLEYVQFHPTVFFAGNAPRFLVTEALRGEGAVLVNAAGQRFMDELHPMGSLAPRDVVARAIHRELAVSGAPCVYLDTSSLDGDFLRERFPGIYQRCLEFGVDLARQPIPVVPAAHYSCGGVHTDLDGRSNVRNLNAIGETACTGLHGANRLASTSLLECLTGARATAQADIADIRQTREPLPEPRAWHSPRALPDAALVQQDLSLVKQTMWNYAGIVRSPRRLARARRILLGLREEIQTFYRDCRLTPELVELRNAVQTALLVVHAAGLNPRSKGCHYVESDGDNDPHNSFGIAGPGDSLA
ncbi:MAG TPA: FAD-dependent oxidoreductase [Xanthomonadales bacterium]|nr:FAD-dependent oxidoreductase [Xanthomonadales bacterium]